MRMTPSILRYTERQQILVYALMERASAPTRIKIPPSTPTSDGPSAIVQAGIRPRERLMFLPRFSSTTDSLTKIFITRRARLSVSSIRVTSTLPPSTTHNSSHCYCSIETNIIGNTKKMKKLYVTSSHNTFDQSTKIVR